MTQVETGTLIPYVTEMFRIQAWISLGKVAHPVTGKLERDLDAARQMIDLLAELETRTEGNRSADETRLLRGALTELRINYLEEMKKPAESPPSQEPSPEESGPEAQTEPK
jgi:uncharacterized protein DUF1844